MVIQITSSEVERLINQRLRTGSYKDAEDVIFQALQVIALESISPNKNRLEAIGRLINFGQLHRLSLGNTTIRELRHEARACTSR